MPGPSVKSKVKKAKVRQSSRSTTSFIPPEPFVGEIEHAADWHIIVEILCSMLDIPDLTTRSGLKQVHADFSNIYSRLSDVYDTHRDNEKITGGIVGIFAKMCADSLLRDKLFEKGFLSKLTPLLNVPYCRHLALRSLSVITHHGGINARKEIAKQIPTLIRVMKENPHDPSVIELSVVTMSHAISAVVFTDELPHRKILQLIDIRDVLEVTLENMRKQLATHYMMNHAIPLLAGPTLHCPDVCKDYPPLLKFLTACLRSNDLTIRCAAIGGLIRLHHQEAKPERVFHDPMKLVACIKKGFPDNIVDIMMDYGLYRCDTYATLAATRDFQQAMMTVVQTHDLLTLGRNLASLIVKTEFSVADGYFETENPRTGKRERLDTGLPFKSYSESLPVCAKELRKTGKAQDLDFADVIDLKYLIIRQRIPEAIAIAKKAIERNPEIAYFYYAITLGADDEDGLRYAKKGLKAKHITHFNKFAMLYRAVEHAGNMGVTKLQEASVGDKNWEEGYAFLASALEDSKTFMQEGPPDSRHMQNMLNWYIILSLTYRGSELSIDLKELQEAMEKLEIAAEFSRLLGMPFADSIMRLTRQTVLKNYGPGVKEWGDVVSRFDSLSSMEAEEIPKDKVDDDLASWLDSKLHVEDAIQEEQPKACSHPIINPNRVELYRCSWCATPVLCCESAEHVDSLGTVMEFARKITGTNTRRLVNRRAQLNEFIPQRNV